MDDAELREQLKKMRIYIKVGDTAVYTHMADDMVEDVMAIVKARDAARDAAIRIDTLQRLLKHHETIAYADFGDDFAENYEVIPLGKVEALITDIKAERRESDLGRPKGADDGR